MAPLEPPIPGTVVWPRVRVIGGGLGQVHPLSAVPSTDILHFADLKRKKMLKGTKAYTLAHQKVDL